MDPDFDQIVALVVAQGPVIGQLEVIDDSFDMVVDRIQRGSLVAKTDVLL